MMLQADVVFVVVLVLLFVDAVTLCLEPPSPVTFPLDLRSRITIGMM